MEGCKNYTGILFVAVVVLLQWSERRVTIPKVTLAHNSFMATEYKCTQGIPCRSPFHVDPQKNISEKEEGDEQGHSLYGVSDLSAPGRQGEVHNHQHKVDKDQHHSKYSREKDTRTHLAHMIRKGMGIILRIISLGTAQ